MGLFADRPPKVRIPPVPKEEFLMDDYPTEYKTFESPENKPVKLNISKVPTKLTVAEYRLLNDDGYEWDKDCEVNVDSVFAPDEPAEVEH